MKKHFILLIVTIFVCILSSNAQSPEVLKAKEILDKVSAKTKAYPAIVADFSFMIENLQANITETFNGTITIKGGKYKAELMDIETYFDGTTLWTYMPDANEVNISDASMMEDDMLDPASVFTIYEKDFKYIHAGEETINGKKVDIIDLFPDKRDKPFSRIKLYIYKDNLQFAKISQIGKDGTNYIIDIKKMNVNTSFEDSFFRFDTSKRQGIVVIDLR